MQMIIRYLSLLALFFIVSCAVPVSDSHSNMIPAPQKNHRLGTEWGEGLQDTSRKVTHFKRIEQTPISIIDINYSSAPLKGTIIKEIMLANGRIGLSILNEKGQKMALTQRGAAIHLQGNIGDRYQLFYRSYNQNGIYEIITTVDGLDVINGSAGSFSNHGYILYPEKTLTISGFRKSSQEVAAFRFAPPYNAYATNSSAGDIRNVGIIGTAIFTLIDTSKPKPAPSSSKPNAFPNEKGYAPAPRYRH